MVVSLMELTSPIAQFAANLTSEIVANAGETRGPATQSNDFEELIALLSAATVKIADEVTVKTNLTIEPPAGVHKTPGKQRSQDAGDVDYASEATLGAITAGLVEIPVLMKEPPLHAYSGVEYETKTAPMDFPSDLQFASSGRPAVQNTVESDVLGIETQAKLKPVIDQTMSLPKSLERPNRIKFESAKIGAPPNALPEVQGAPAAVPGNNQQTSSPLSAHAFGVPSTHSPAHEFTQLAPNAPDSHLFSVGKFDPGLHHADRAFVVLSSKQSRDGSFELRLDPPELGSVRISLSPDENGAIRALVTADRAETLDLVRRHIDVFRAEAGIQGLNNLDFRFEAGFQNRNSSDPEKKKPAPRFNDQFAVGFDGDVIYSSPLTTGMDVFA